MNELAPPRLATGIHAGVPEDVYHADPAPEPSASASILKKLDRQSPEHARDAHPRLNPAWRHSAATEAMEVGTILHALMLGTEQTWRVYEYDSWRGKAADVRDGCREAGIIPILAHKLEPIEAMAASYQRRIERDFPKLHSALHDPDTLKEATIITRINGVMCRCRVDLLPPPQYGFMGDLKFTGLDAPPDEYERTVRREYRYQSNLYPRMVEATRGDAPEFRFYCAEEKAPHGMACYAFGPGATERNGQRVDLALEKWAACLAANEWPGYPTLIHTIEDEPWEEARDGNAALRHSAAASVSVGMIKKIHEISARIGGPLR